MKVRKLKNIILSTLVALIMGVCSYPFAVYYFHDVEKLITHYPEFKIVKGEVEDYTIVKNKPRYWVRLNEISAYGKWAIILSEDWGFYQHQGFDIEQLKIAVNDGLKGGKKLRGASTISQQMVKNVYLDNSRSYFRKFKELILTYKVEKYLSKQRILEIYLNSIEFGPGIWGIRNASYHYFKKHPSSLNPREASFLAMLLPSPKRYYESYRRKTLTRFARVRVNSTLTKLKMARVITQDEYIFYRYFKMSWEH